MDYTPLYIQIKKFILDKINNGEFKPGDKIPTEKELSSIFKVSRITASVAIKELAKEGYVDRKKGKGSFVIEKTNENNFIALIKYAFEDKNNKEIKNTKHKTININCILPVTDIAKKMALKPGKKVNEIIRLKYIQDMPTAVEMIYISEEHTGKLENEAIDDEKFVYNFLLEEFGMTPKRTKLFMEPISAGVFESEHLEVDIGNPLIMLELFQYDEKENLIVFSRSIINNKRSKLFIDFQA